MAHSVFTVDLLTYHFSLCTSERLIANHLVLTEPNDLKYNYVKGIILLH